MPTNALLVRWANGYREATDAASIATWGRREALLGLGAAQSEGEVDRITAERLVAYAEPRTEITLDVAPVDDTDTPYIAFTVGDTYQVPDEGLAAAPQRVLAMTLTEDEDGHVSYVPQLGSIIPDGDVAVATALKKMLKGTLGGDKVATPVSQIVSPPNPFPPHEPASA